MKRELTLNVDGEEITVTAVREGETIHVERDGVEYSVRIVADSVVGIRAASQQPTGTVPTATAARPSQPRRSAPTAASPSQGAGGAGTITSPMTGVIDQVLVAEGAVVKEGDIVVILEAMKMYIDVVAPAAGTVTGVTAKAGDSVKEGAVLLSIG